MSALFDAVRDISSVDAAERAGIALERRGGNYWCRCPAHSEKTASLKFYGDTGGWYCFGCGKGGDAVRLYEEMYHVEAVEAARMLDIRPGDPITIVRRLLKFAQKPVVIDEIYLPGEVFQGLTLEVLQSWSGSLYSLFEADYGVRMIRAEEHLRAVAAAERSAELLQIEVGAPLLLVERTAYTYGNRPVEWRRGLYCTRRHYYRNDLG